MIYTSHYMEEVEAICQRIAIVDHGKVLVEGSLDDLLRVPEPLLELTLDRPFPAALIESYAPVRKGADKYHLKLASTAALPRLLDELATAGIEVRQLNFGQPDLEQVFMRLTQRSLRD